MLLSDLQNEVMANGFDPVNFGTSRITQFINDGYQYICAQVSFTGDEAVLDFPTVSGQSKYPAPTDASDIRDIYDTDRNRQLLPTTLRTMDRSPSGATGQPQYYALNGSNFQLWPTPNAVYNLECRYWKIPPLLSAPGDTPSLIPPMWHWLLWTWAVAQCFRAEDDVQRATAWDQRFQKGLSDFAARVQFTSDGPSTAQSMWNQRPALGRYGRYWTPG